MKKALFFGLVAVSTVFLVLAAEAGIGIEPSGLETMLSAGKKEEGVFKITNTGEAPMEINVEIQDWLKTGVDPQTWVSIQPEKDIVQAGETKDFKYTVNIPETGPAEYMAMVFFQSRAEKSTVSAGISVPIYVAVKERADIKAEILDYKVDYNIKDGFSGYLKIENKGNVHLRPFIRVFITNDQNEQVHYFNLPYGVPIQVGLQREYDFPKDVFKLEPGTYNLVIECDYGLIYNVDKKAYKEVKITVPKEEAK